MIGLCDVAWSGLVREMSLLREIQTSLMADQNLGPILLKLRFLASRLGSGLLEEWVKHESEGYPNNVEVPDYRKIGVSYKGTFYGPFGSGIQNAPLPSYLIEKFAGSKWTSYEIRASVAALDDLLSSGKDTSGSLEIDASNLILLLQGKVYERYACNSVTGTISKSSIAEIQNSVRTRVLDLTIKLEKLIPAAAEITVGAATKAPPVKQSETVTQITQQIIHGNVTTIASSGQGTQFYINVGERDDDALIKALVDSGITKSDAAELTKILASEEPESKEEPFGKKAKAWIVKNINKAANGTWKVGVAVATNVLTEAALRYYGLK